MGDKEATSRTKKEEHIKYLKKAISTGMMRALELCPGKNRYCRFYYEALCLLGGGRCEYFRSAILTFTTRKATKGESKCVQ